jgi:hypothetical protein
LNSQGYWLVAAAALQRQRRCRYGVHLNVRKARIKHPALMAALLAEQKFLATKEFLTAKGRRLL